MRKALAVFLAMTMLCLLGTVAYAEENEIQLDGNTMTGTTEVSLTVDRAADTFVVVIPSSVKIDPKTHYGYGNVTLKAGWELISVNKLMVKLTGAENGVRDGQLYAGNSASRSYSNDDIKDSDFQNFKLKSENNDSVTYAIKASNLPWPFSSIDSRSVNTNQWYYYESTLYTTSLISVSKGKDNTEDTVSELAFYVATMPQEPGVYNDKLTFSIITE